MSKNFELNTTRDTMKREKARTFVEEHDGIPMIYD